MGVKGYPYLFHYEEGGGGNIFMCLSVGLGGQTVLHAVFAPVPFAVTCRVARRVYRVQDSGAYISFGGGIRILLRSKE